MTGRPRPPDPGSPAWTATADQYTAAQADTTARAAALLAAGALLIPATGPWAAAMLDSVAAERTRRLVCPHVAAARGPLPLHVVRPRLLVCAACVSAVETAEATARPLCHICGRPGDRPDGFDIRTAIAQRALVIARGRFCPSCLYAEQRATRATH